MMSKLQLRDRLILERAKQLGIPKPSDAEVEARARAELRAEAQRAIAALEPITLEDLSEAGAEFEKVETRGGFYDLARGLVENGYALEGRILLLATWNAARFSKVHFEIGPPLSARTAGARRRPVDLLFLPRARENFAILAKYSL